MKTEHNISSDMRILIFLSVIVVFIIIPPKLLFAAQNNSQFIADPDKFEQLKGDNSISNISLLEVNPDYAKIKIKYFFNGGTNRKTVLKLTLNKKNKIVYKSFLSSPAVKLGKNEITITVKRPLPISESFLIDKIHVRMADISGMTYATKEENFNIKWPASNRKILGVVHENLKIIEITKHYVDIDMRYYYKNKYFKDIYIDVLANQSKNLTTGRTNSHRYELKEGIHDLRIRINRGGLPSKPTVTTSLKFVMFSDDVFVEEEVPMKIVWPSRFGGGSGISEINKKNINDKYNKAVSLIDKGVVGEANKILDGILLFDDTYLNVYPQLARIYMATEPNKDGLKKAEDTLKIALSQDNKHQNSLILLGYVYTHQRKYSEAEQLFNKVDKRKNKNIWLFVNWGELYIYQNKIKNAILKLNEAVNKERQYGTYDRAQIRAFDYLFSLYEKNNLNNDMENTYKLFFKKYPDYPCKRAKFAHFLLSVKYDYVNAKANVVRAYDEGCQDPRMIPDKSLILGAINYVEWNERIGEKDSVRLFNRAKLFFEEGPFLYEYLASYKPLRKVLDNLIKNGSNLNKVDTNGHTAITASIFGNDVNALNYLVKKGADINKKLDDQGNTPLILAIRLRRKDIAKEIVKLGGDVNIKLSNGLSVKDIAKKFKMDDVITPVLKGI